jgi:hypothetical protein
MRRALAVDGASFGAGHPRVAIDLKNRVAINLKNRVAIDLKNLALLL